MKVAIAGAGAVGRSIARELVDHHEVTLLERDPALARSLQASATRLGAESIVVRCTDALSWMAGAEAGRFDLVLIDPPWDAGLLQPALMHALPLVADGGFVYLESGDDLPAPPDGFGGWREGRAGAVHHGLWRRGYTAADR